MTQMHQLAMIVLLCIITSCVIQTTQGGDGGATETVNARVIISDSTVTVNITSDVVVAADILIFDENYNPVTNFGFCDSAIDISADSGIVFSKLSGIYNIIIKNRHSQTSLAFNNIIAGTSSSDTISDILSVPGSIEGIVSFNKSSSTDKQSILVYLRGTSFNTVADSLGRFQIHDIPGGEYYIKAIMSFLKDSSGKSVGKKIEVKSSMTTDSLTLFFSE